MSSTLDRVRARFPACVCVRVSVPVLALGLGAAACAVTPARMGSSFDDPDPPGVAEVTLDISPTEDQRPISPLIYGWNDWNEFPDPANNRFGSARLGGNRWTAFNWENGASNAGNDANFVNDAYLVRFAAAADADAPGGGVRYALERSKASGIPTVLTVPIVDYVAADKRGGDVRVTPDYLSARFHENLPTRGTPPAGSPTVDTADDSVYQDEFVAWVKNGYAAEPVIFSLDNEPDLWSGTHQAIHPAATTYAELITRSTSFAGAIKAVWPEAPVTGFVSYGWNGYVSLQEAPDRAGRDFVNFYLDEMRAAEAAAGKRLIDYLDLHWYPEARGPSSATAGGPRIVFERDDGTMGVAYARVQAPRSLWDPDYLEESWIRRNVGAIRLIPRMKEKIAEHYPGTKLAITEWGYGGGNNITGAVAVADVLGIFGREGVELATLWNTNGSEVFNQAAFRVYTNYDGQGARFGDTAVRAVSSSQDSASVHAAVDAAAPSRLVIVAINKRAADTTAVIKIAGGAHTRASVFRLDADAPEIKAQSSINSTSPGQFRYVMPSFSISIVVPS
jgi:hypothetical protein